MATKEISLNLVAVSCLSLLLHLSYSFNDTLHQGQQLRDYDILVSAGGTFKLGFFSPGNSRNRYLGISYNLVDEKQLAVAKKNVVWIANRNNPISDASGVLAIDELGKLGLSYNGGTPIALSSAEATSNVSATLLDSGNFVLQELDLDGSVKQRLWQSFDYPTDTLLPGMKLGYDTDMKHVWKLTSWINHDVPAEGSFAFTIGTGIAGVPMLVIWWKGAVYWTSGNWQNQRFEFIPRFSNECHVDFSFVSNENETYFTSSVSENHCLSSYMIDSSGEIKEKGGVAFGDCFYRFDPGCVERKLPECRSKTDKFESRIGSTYGEALKFDESYNLSLIDCRAKCWNDCSCVAYAYASSNKTSCELWNGEMRFTETKDGTREIYILVRTKKAKRWIWPVLIPVGVVVVMACIGYYYLQRRKRKSVDNRTEEEKFVHQLNDVPRQRAKNYQLQFLSFDSVVSATDNFATANKLGQGGFGSVYKVQNK